MRRLIYILPILVMVALGVVFWRGLDRDPRLIPSVLINKPAPAFVLPAVAGEGPGLALADLKGKVTFLNFFASWCIPCREEHPLVMDLARTKRVWVVGIAYKDKPAALKEWLGRLGDPYAALGDDSMGRVGIDFGVTGVPESYLIDRQGVIRFKQIGPLTPDVITKTILPMAAELSK